MEAIADRRARAEGYLIVFVVPTARHTALDRPFDPVEFAVEYEVDNTGDGVSTVGRRSAAGHDFDALDQLLREKIDVDISKAVGRYNPPAV